MKTKLVLALLILSMTGGSGCAGMKKFFAAENAQENGVSRPIHNPFGEQYSNAQGGGDKSSGNMILRTRKGDRAVEIELPRSEAGMTDFVIPVSPAFKDGRAPASSMEDGIVDETYRDRQLGVTDREIIAGMPQGLPEDAAKRREIEQGLQLMPSEDGVPEGADTQSYLANLDRVKQLYKFGRYEAGLLEVDQMIRLYPTDPKLYAMRGTLLDRLGKHDLAVKSWNQSLRFDPSNQSLRRFIERKQLKRGVAGQ